MTEEYRILEETDDHQILMEEARMVGENVMAIVHSIKDLWFPTLEELRLSAPHPHLTEYSLNVLEGMGLITHSDLDDPYWNDCRPDRTNTEGYRAVDRRDPHWIALAIVSTDNYREDPTGKSGDSRQHRSLLSRASCPSGVRSARISARRRLLFLNMFSAHAGHVSAAPPGPSPGTKAQEKKKMENCNSEMLNRAMRNAGIRNGFDEIQAEFSAFRDFKLKWTRSYKWISFEVSDYLRNAPEHVMQSLAETVFARIRGEDRTAYSEEVCDYLNSREFLEENQGMYLKRFRGISETARGESVDLLDCYRRLAERGLVEYDPDLVIRWNSIGDRSRKVGRSSVLMRTVVMNPALDSEDVSEDALDYALFSQICHVNLGFGPTREDDAERYEEMLDRYPDRVQVETELRRMGLNI